MLVPARRHDAEWMDRPDNSFADLDAALGDIAWANRSLGGRRALLRGVTPWMVPGSDLAVLDVGTGGADLPLALVDAGQRRRCPVRVTAVDRDPSTAAIAARDTAHCPAVRVVRADAFALPFADGTFDVATASLFLHHFPHDDVVRLLLELVRVSDRAVVVNDLRRHRVPWAFVAAVGRLTRRHPMFVHDGPLSVLRGFTDVELLRAAAEIPGIRAELRRVWPYRLVLTLRIRPREPS